MFTVRVNASSPYDAHIGSGILNNCGDIIRPVFNGSNAVLFADAQVYKLYGETVARSLERAGINVHVYLFPSGENSKSARVLIESLEFAAERGLTRSDIIIALGGGVAGDLAGMCAGLYMRGIKCALLPTTLLAQADSSVGGKTAINLEAGKNLAGLFNQPCAVIADTRCLNTLSAEEYACGMAEVIKMGVISGAMLFSMCERGTRCENDADIVRLCVLEKARVTEKDERDTGGRAILNLGHTYAHAIEKLSGYSVKHGFAVAMGMSIAVRAAYRMGDMSICDCERVISALEKNGLNTVCGYSARDIHKTAAHDKKRDSDALTIIVPKGIGMCEPRRVGFSEFFEYVEAGL